MNFWGSWEKEPLGNMRSQTPCDELVGLLTLPVSEVHRARSRKTGAQVALKKIIMHHEKDGVCGCA